MEVCLVILFTAILFLAMILLLASKPKYAAKITGAFIVAVAVGGLLIYGYGFSVTIPNFPLAVIRALLAVCGMYVGKNELSAIADTPLMQNDWMHLVFWLLHLFALYATASAAITTVGAEALKKLRLWLAHRGQMNLIYGVHEGSVDLGRQLIGRKKNVVVFVDAKPDPAQAAAIMGAGCVLRSDAAALVADPRFLRVVGIGKTRDITLYATSRNADANIRYAKKLLISLEQRGVAPERTRLVILSKDDGAIHDLQVSPGKYGFGYISAFHEAELAARLLIRNYPPCEHLAFDEVGRATENMETLIVGFGQTGQAVLRQLVMNGQFEGSTFRSDVFALDCDSTDGFFTRQFGSLLEHYDITFHTCDARRRRMYAYLDDHAQRLKYVVICTGNEKLNHELAEELASYLRQRGVAVPLYLCGNNAVVAYKKDGLVHSHTKLYDPELLSLHGLDKMAMILNHRYQATPDKTPLENWMACDYFSRQSCRASADFIGAMLRAAGKTEAQAMENWQLPENMLLNLSKTEHHRWCAFHFCMGFSPMTDAEFDNRAQCYLRQKEAEGKATIRITKNMAGCTHACLVSWEALQDLSEKEASITGKYTDYQKMDEDNVLAVPALLRALSDSEM